MKKPLLIANWKMNPATAREAIPLAQKIEQGIARLRGAEVVIAPSFPFLSAIGAVLRKARLGAQNVFWENEGPYTGEVSVRQLCSVGVKYVIIGHSERKIQLGETDEMINKKIRAALGEGLLPILCVGERERSDNDIPPEVGDQLKNSLSGIPKNAAKNLTVCYEPIWAISTQPGSRPDTPESAFRAMLYIRKVMAGLYDRRAADSVRIIYGGSVNSANAAPFLREGKMEGVLVGGASLDADEFAAIVKAAAKTG